MYTWFSRFFDCNHVSFGVQIKLLLRSPDLSNLSPDQRNAFFRNFYLIFICFCLTPADASVDGSPNVRQVRAAHADWEGTLRDGLEGAAEGRRQARSICAAFPPSLCRRFCSPHTKLPRIGDKTRQSARLGKWWTRRGDKWSMAFFRDFPPSSKTLPTTVTAFTLGMKTESSFSSGASIANHLSHLSLHYRYKLNK